MESNVDKENNEEESVHIEDGYLDTLIDDSLENDNEEEELLAEESLTENEIEDLIAELLEVESKAAEAEEALEEESLVKVEADVRKEFAQSLSGDDMEKAVLEKMLTVKEEWEAELDGLETDSAYFLAQLDGAGIELPSLYKCIEMQAPNGCCTEAWKKRTHWIGMEILRTHRPVRRRHGKILDEGASGFLGKKIVMDENIVAGHNGVNANRDSFVKMAQTLATIYTEITPFLSDSFDMDVVLRATMHKWRIDIESALKDAGEEWRILSMQPPHYEVTHMPTFDVLAVDNPIEDVGGDRE